MKIKVKAILMILLMVTSIYGGSVDGSGANMQSNSQHIAHQSVMDNSNIINSAKIEQFNREVQEYQDRVKKEWLLLILMGISGLGALVLVFINLLNIKKMQDDIEGKQDHLMKDIEESEKYV